MDGNGNSTKAMTRRFAKLSARSPHELEDCPPGLACITSTMMNLARGYARISTDNKSVTEDTPAIVTAEALQPPSKRIDNRASIQSRAKNENISMRPQQTRSRASFESKVDNGRRPSLTLAAGTFEYDAAGEGHDDSDEDDKPFPRQSNKAVTMDYHMPIRSNEEVSEKGSNNGDTTGSPLESTAADPSTELPQTEDQRGNSVSDVTTDDDAILNDTDKRRAAPLAMLIVVLAGSVCLVALIIALAVISVRLLESQQKNSE
ncbi:hypothetical protein MPSEU_000561200 [Mayamaea pseudoterrestris]|nr:hypothetical protein MPSEU_000561200 [Mayamaea pseudoterrestris]